MNFELYQSPFTWRYASSEMRELWSQKNKRLLWRKMWVALAEVQSDFGLVTKEQLCQIAQTAWKSELEHAGRVGVREFKAGDSYGRLQDLSRLIRTRIGWDYTGGHRFALVVEKICLVAVQNKNT